MRAHRYRRILAIREARLPVLATAIDRIPIASLSLATILLIHAETGSFKTAGIVEAAFALATAVSLPVQGRLVDRLGQTEVLGIAVVLNPITLIGLVVAAHAGAETAMLALIAALCGATTPATGSCMRALWGSLVTDAGLRQSAFALDAISLEVAFILGPLITGGLVAVGSPTLAILFNAALVAIGTLLFVVSRASRAWHGDAGPRHWAGPLRSRAIVLIVFVELCFGVAIGAMEISITAFATGEGSAGLAGVLIAAQAAASFAAGAWYGSRHHATPAAGRYVRLSFLLALGLVPLLFTTSIVEAIPLMALSGLALAPATAALYSLVDELAPAGTATEAFTWMITSIAAGVAGGQAVGGLLVNGGHPHRGFAAAVVAAGIGAAIAFAARLRFQAAPSAA
jgi:Major Facilitator Superfamily